MKTFSHEIGQVSYNIWIGQNARENWDLIDKSESDNLWFHLDEYPSSHVVVSLDTINPDEIFYPNEIIVIACDYCKKNSKLKNTISKVRIVYTQIKNLKKGKQVGSVLVSEQKYFFI